MFILILLIIIIVLLVRNIVIVPQGFVEITEFLGSYKETWQPGLHLKIPFFERVAKVINIKEVVGDFPAIQAITKDNVMLTVDSVVFYKVRTGENDVRKFAYGVTNPNEAIQLLAATNLRNVIGEMTLDEALTSRDKINDSMRTSLDTATDDWGIEVRRVELKSLTPSEKIRDVMERQKTAAIEKEAEILEAEGHKQADILKAQGHKEAIILDAEADKQRQILAAEADEQSRIHKAKGEAEAIRLVQEAEANGIKALNDANATAQVLTLKKYDALEKVADGRATKILMPTDLVDMSKTATVLNENFHTNEVDGLGVSHPIGHTTSWGTGAGTHWSRNDNKSEVTSWGVSGGCSTVSGVSSRSECHDTEIHSEAMCEPPIVKDIND